MRTGADGGAQHIPCNARVWLGVQLRFVLVSRGRACEAACSDNYCRYKPIYTLPSLPATTPVPTLRGRMQRNERPCSA